MKKSLGLVGAHRTGKTTTCLRLVETRQSFKFFRSSAAGTYTRRGWDPQLVKTMKDRLDIQADILSDYRKQYLEAESSLSEGEILVTDRTPLDFAMYTIADASQHCDDSHFESFRTYISDCIEATNQLFSTVCLIQPGIPIVHEEGKAAPNSLYIEHLNWIALALQEEVKCQKQVMPRVILDLEHRVNMLDYYVNSQ